MEKPLSSPVNCPRTAEGCSSCDQLVLQTMRDELAFCKPDLTVEEEARIDQAIEGMGSTIAFALQESFPLASLDIEVNGQPLVTCTDRRMALAQEAARITREYFAFGDDQANHS